LLRLLAMLLALALIQTLGLEAALADVVLGGRRVVALAVRTSSRLLRALLRLLLLLLCILLALAGGGRRRLAELAKLVDRVALVALTARRERTALLRVHR